MTKKDKMLEKVMNFIGPRSEAFMFVSCTGEDGMMEMRAFFEDQPDMSDPEKVPDSYRLGLHLITVLQSALTERAGETEH
jgi:hypothetical protein